MNEIELTSLMTWTSVTPALVLGGLSFLWGQSRLARREREQLLEIQALKDYHHQALLESQNTAKTLQAQALAEAETRFRQELAEAKRNDLTVSVYPFVNTAKDEGLIFKDTRIEIGYKYQLFVKGFPCFAPHVEVTESFVQKEVNQESLNQLVEKAERLARAAVSAKTAPAGNLIEVARASVGKIAEKK